MSMFVWQHSVGVTHIRLLCSWWDKHTKSEVTMAVGNIINTLRPRQNCRHFADGNFKCIFLSKNYEFRLKFHWLLFLRVQITLFQNRIMTWRRPGYKPLSETIMVRLPTHICVTRPQWFNTLKLDLIGHQFANASTWNQNAILWFQLHWILVSYVSDVSIIVTKPLSEPMLALYYPLLFKLICTWYLPISMQIRKQMLIALSFQHINDSKLVILGNLVDRNGNRTTCRACSYPWLS